MIVKAKIRRKSQLLCKILQMGIYNCT